MPFQVSEVELEIIVEPVILHSIAAVAVAMVHSRAEVVDFSWGDCTAANTFCPAPASVAKNDALTIDEPISASTDETAVTLASVVSCCCSSRTNTHLFGLNATSSRVLAVTKSATGKSRSAAHSRRQMLLGVAVSLFRCSAIGRSSCLGTPPEIVACGPTTAERPFATPPAPVCSVRCCSLMASLTSFGCEIVVVIHSTGIFSICPLPNVSTLPPTMNENNLFDADRHRFTFDDRPASWRIEAEGSTVWLTHVELRATVISACSWFVASAAPSGSLAQPMCKSTLSSAIPPVASHSSTTAVLQSSSETDASSIFVISAPKLRYFSELIFAVATPSAPSDSFTTSIVASLMFGVSSLM